MSNLKNYRSDFPLLDKDPSFIYLDSAATSLKPSCVIDRLKQDFSDLIPTLYKGYSKYSSLSFQEYNKTRSMISNFLGLDDSYSNHIVFSRSCTYGIDIVAKGWLRDYLSRDDEILITNEEHHSNILPFLSIVADLNSSKNLGVSLQVADISKDISYYDSVVSKINDRTKFISLSLVGNVYGRINLEYIKSIIKKAHSIGAKVLVDAAQAGFSVKIDVKDIDCDFLVLSSHKIFALNTGILYIKDSKVLEELYSPILGGGSVSNLNLDMDSILKEGLCYKKEDVEFERIQKTFPVPQRLEIATLPVVETISLKYALEYISSIGLSNIISNNKKMVSYIRQSFKNLDFIELVDRKYELDHGIEDNLSSIVSFNVKGVHPHDVCYLLAEKNICIRSGYQCASMLFNTLKISGSNRVSVGIYTTYEDIDKLVGELKNIYKLLVR